MCIFLNRNVDLSHFYGYGRHAGGGEGKNEKEHENILRLMSLLTSKEGAYASGTPNENGNYGTEDDFDDEDEEQAIDLGYYGNYPYPISVSSGKSSKMSQFSPGPSGGLAEPIAIMSSNPPTETNRRTKVLPYFNPGTTPLVSSPKLMESNPDPTGKILILHSYFMTHDPRGKNEYLFIL